ncbi:MAG: hypothetical protein K6B65_01290 [Bacilli bacterium]|nr:hypothetical protein [Bacilli bacterium]
MGMEKIRRFDHIGEGGEKTSCAYQLNKDAKALLLHLNEEGMLSESLGLVETLARDCFVPFSYLGIGLKEGEIALPFPSVSPFGKRLLRGDADKAIDKVIRITAQLKLRYPELESLPIVLGGYSLCGLLSLYASYRSSLFPYIASCSPSLWYEGWMEFIKEENCLAKKLYVSLGDREEKSKNKVFSKVGEVTRGYTSYLKEEGYDVTLVYNKGGHFNDPEQRMADGFRFHLESL